MNSMVRLLTVRNLLLAILFVVVVMAIYFALIPADYYRRDNGRGGPSMEDDWAGVGGESSILDYNNASWIKEAKTVAKRGGVVYTTMINDAYFDFAASWLCNTRALKDVHQRVLLLTTDRRTGEKLKALGSGVSVVGMSSLQFAGSQEYSRAGYVRMMVERTRFILTLLTARIPVFLFEVDCLWLADPLALMQSAEFASADIVATKVSERNVVAGGFLLLRPTEPTLSLWQRLTEMMEELREKILNADATAPVSESLNDQEFITSLIHAKHANVDVRYLPDNRFLDGKWYSMSAGERSASQPIIINNNWVVGNAAKIERAKKFGHWFWDESKHTCDAAALNHLFKS
jgi:hypothetical protein